MQSLTKISYSVAALQSNKCTCFSKRPPGFSGELETQMLKAGKLI